MDGDERVEAQIEALEGEREKLRAREGFEDRTLRHDAARLEEIRIELDRLWDLLRHRRALRHAGADPDEAGERPAGTVEGYLQ